MGVHVSLAVDMPNTRLHATTSHSVTMDADMTTAAATSARKEPTAWGFTSHEEALVSGTWLAPPMRKRPVCDALIEEEACRRSLGYG